MRIQNVNDENNSKGVYVKQSSDFFWYLKNWILQPVIHAPCLSNLIDYMGEETCSVFILEVCTVTLNIKRFLQRYVWYG